MKKSVALNVMKNTGKILEFQKISQNRFVVSTSSTNLNKEDYVSKIYESSYNPQGKIIIFPRISLQLKNNRTIKNILDVCNTKVSIEKNNHQKYILKCNVDNSDQVLSIVNIIDKMEEVELCEPEMLSDYKSTNTLYPQQYYLKIMGKILVRQV